MTQKFCIPMHGTYLCKNRFFHLWERLWILTWKLFLFNWWWKHSGFWLIENCLITSRYCFFFFYCHSGGILEYPLQGIGLCNIFFFLMGDEQLPIQQIFHLHVSNVTQGKGRGQYCLVFVTWVVRMRLDAMFNCLWHWLQIYLLLKPFP